MAYRMQASVPELVDLSKEPQATWDLYGPDAKEPGTFAYNCLLARRMAAPPVPLTQPPPPPPAMHPTLPPLFPTTSPHTHPASHPPPTNLPQPATSPATLAPR